MLAFVYFFGIQICFSVLQPSSVSNGAASHNVLCPVEEASEASCFCRALCNSGLTCYKLSFLNVMRKVFKEKHKAARKSQTRKPSLQVLLLNTEGGNGLGECFLPEKLVPCMGADPWLLHSWWTWCSAIRDENHCVIKACSSEQAFIPKLKVVFHSLS